MCRVATEKASLDAVEVAVPGQTFTLDLKKVPVTIELEEGASRTTTIQVLAPLRFVASYPSDKLVYRIKQRLELAGGRIRLGKLAGYTWLGVRGDGMLLSLQSSLGIDLREPIIVPCSNVELGNGGLSYATPAALSAPRKRTIGAGTAFFPLYLAPGEGDHVDIQYPGPFEVLQRHRGWVQLQAAWEDGSRVRGWTRQEFTTSAVSLPLGWGGGGGGGIGCLGSDGPLVVRVRLRKDAAIAASPAGPVWASVAQAIAVDALPSDPSQGGWVQVHSVPGLIAPCIHDLHIWVQARDVVGPVPRAYGK
ncbi:MAG: hypothetical protein ABSB49_18330 [Polyangia bacterium]|jgi:hypothetical protein